MKAHRQWIPGLVIMGAALGVPPAVAASDGAGQGGTVSLSHVAFSHPLAPLNGAHLEATVVEVTYPPGAASATHRHPCPVIGYVLEGALRMQVKGKPETIYKAGDTFYEAPTDVHVVSANASRVEPARFLAYFVYDHPTPLSVPVTGGRAGGK